MGDEYVKGVAAAARRCSWALGEDWGRMVRLEPHGEEVGLLGLGRALAGRCGRGFTVLRRRP
jgi:hypothetical protein